VNDPNGTGLIGLQFSPVTYGRSDLSDALTTTNPNFSAALVEMLYRLRIGPGDTIGINWDGTFPALNIQILAVCKTLGLYPVIVTAQSAGMWGANYPGFTWLELERLLVDSELWGFSSRFVTMGGEDDNGRGLPPEGRAIFMQKADSVRVPLLACESLSEAVGKRLEIFSRCRVLIATGLPVVNSGDPLLRLPSRVYTGRHRKAGAGLITQFLNKGKAVIHIAKPSRVALDYRLPVAPVPAPEIGKGRLFFERRYSVLLALVFAMVILILLALVVRYDVEYHFGVKSSEEEREAV
ncbi:MAG: poly-gamma-glutamate system protein, partial [bacterium]